MQKKLSLALCVLLLPGALAVSCSFSIAKQQPTAIVTRVLDTATPVPPGITPPVNAVSGSIDARVSTPVSIFKDGLPNTSEAQEIIRVIQRSREISVETSQTHDLSKFPTVFVNDPRFDVPAKWLNVVRKATNNPTLEKAGYLDFRIASYTELWQEQQAYATLHPDLTNTPPPTATVPPGVTFVLFPPPPPLIFESMSIEDDIATVKVDEGARTFEFILVLVNGQWYIASGNIISIHP